MMRILLLCAALVVAGDELSELKVKLRDKNKWTRQSAVEKLADVGSTEAWEEIVGVLDDPAGEVGDTAQWELGRVAGEDAIELLFEKEGLGAKDEWVRLRVAEAIGRVAGPLDPDDVRKAFSEKDARVRRALAASVARRGPSGFDGETKKLVDAVEKQALRDKDERAAGEAWLALVAMDPERARAAWAKQTPAKLPSAVLCAAARSAGALEWPAEAMVVLARSEHASRAVRIDIAAALADLGTAAGARGLVRLLEGEDEERPARRLAAHLREISGLKYGRDPRPWSDWAAKLADDWSPTPPTETWEDDADRSVALAGMPIRSGAIAILIDLSGSMWKDREDGKTRKEIVDEELARCLEALPETTRFNLIPFTGEPKPWKKGLVDARPANTKAAAKWFADIKDEWGTGNFWDAYLHALEDPEVDTILMLGDGEPTGGPRYHLDLLPDLVAHENLGRAVTIDSILIDSGRRTREAWTAIAEASGGVCMEIDL